VSARYSGDRSLGAPAGRLVVFDSRSLAEVKSIPVDVPAGVFSAVRARTVVVGLQPPHNDGDGAHRGAAARHSSGVPMTTDFLRLVDERTHSALARAT